MPRSISVPSKYPLRMSPQIWYRNTKWYTAQMMKRLSQWSEWWSHQRLSHCRPVEMLLHRDNKEWSVRVIIQPMRCVWTHWSYFERRILFSMRSTTQEESSPPYSKQSQSTSQQPCLNECSYPFIEKLEFTLHCTWIVAVQVASDWRLETSEEAEQQDVNQSDN